MNKYLIIDRNTLSRESLRSLIYELDGDSIVYEAESLEHAFNLNIDQPTIEFVIFNPIDEFDNYFSYLDNLNRLSDKSRKLLISYNTQYINYHRLIQKGVGAIVPVNSDKHEVVNAIRSLKNNDSYISPVFLTSKSKSSEEIGPNYTTIPKGYKCRNSIEDKLTKRQIEVLDYLIKGNSNGTIAYELGVSEGTVKLHVSSILKALKVTNRTQAVVRANQFLGVAP